MRAKPEGPSGSAALADVAGVVEAGPSSSSRRFLDDLADRNTSERFLVKECHRDRTDGRPVIGYDFSSYRLSSGKHFGFRCSEEFICHALGLHKVTDRADVLSLRLVRELSLCEWAGHDDRHVGLHHSLDLSRRVERGRNAVRIFVEQSVPEAKERFVTFFCALDVEPVQTGREPVRSRVFPREVGIAQEIRPLPRRELRHFSTIKGLHTAFERVPGGRQSLPIHLQCSLPSS